MHKRIFFKYYSVFVIMVFLTVSLLGFATSAVIGIRSFNSQSGSMERAANKVADMFERLPPNYGIIAGNLIEPSILTIKETINSDIVVFGSDGRAAFSTMSLKQKTVDSFLQDKVYGKVMDGKVYKQARSYGSSDSSVGYTIGVPIRAENGTVTGAVFVTTAALNMSAIIISTFFVYVTCGIVVLIIAFVALIFITYRMTRPIQQMYNAAYAYARGDFSKRITVNDNNEYAPLAHAFNSMADGIETLDAMRKSFVADVSHELRTPMTTITGFIDGILDGTIPQDQQQKYLQTVSDEVHRMSRMVSSFLDIAKIQSGQMSYIKKPFDIITTTGKVLFGFEERIEQQKINLSFEFDSDSMIAVGDEDAIYRVIFNLVDNALKFTPEGGKVIVSSTVKDSKIHLSVYNTGCGIPKEDAAHVFERFYKADKSRGINKRGTGIGLFLVKNIIKEHGEDIILTSKEGEFAKFTFTLPLYTD